MKAKKLPDIKFTDGMTEQEIRSLQKQYQQRADAPYLKYQEEEKKKRIEKRRENIQRIGENLEYSLNRMAGI
jgi:hypothetical protein